MTFDNDLLPEYLSLSEFIYNGYAKWGEDGYEYVVKVNSIKFIDFIKVTRVHFSDAFYSDSIQYIDLSGFYNVEILSSFYESG